MKKFIVYLASKSLLLASILCFVFCVLNFDIKAQNSYPIIEKNGEKYYE